MDGFLVAGISCRASSPLLSVGTGFPTISSLSAAMFVALRIYPACRHKEFLAHGH